MPTTYATRPDPSEYAPYYAGYVSLAPDGDLIAALGTQVRETADLLAPLSNKDAGFRYAPDKWSIKQVVGHMIDFERVFQYRALHFSRHDATPLPGMEQDDYVRYAGYDERRLSDLLEEFAAVRTATMHLFRGLDESMMTRTGTASGSTFTVRAVAYMIAGHERHHVNILRDRYLPGMTHG